MLIVENISKSFGKLKAVDGVSFNIAKGEIFGLLGENGAGKTTTIKMLATLSEPDGGRILLKERDVWKDKYFARNNMAVVSQDMNLEYELTVYENLYCYCLLRGQRSSRSRIEQVLLRLNMSEKRDEKISSLSGGQKRRVMAARALLSEAEMIFMDEPTIGLDPAVRREMWDIINAMRADGKSILLTTHYTDEAEYLCGRVAIMEKGKIIRLDTPDKLVNQAGSYALDISGNGGSRTILFKDSLLLDDYLRVHSFEEYRVRRTKLEDVLITCGRAV